jgi:hypothetical protein
MPILADIIEEFKGLSSNIPSSETSAIAELTFSLRCFDAFDASFAFNHLHSPRPRPMHTDPKSAYNLLLVHSYPSR